MANLEFWEHLPKKRIAAGAILQNKNNEILLVRQLRLNSWTMPGGTVEARESPRNGCIREIREEVGLEISMGRLLCVDYNRNTDGGHPYESIKFVFDGGVVSESAIGKIRAQEDEITECLFFPKDIALEHLHDHGEQLATRVKYALKALKDNTVIYIENGVRVP